jgi:hypothetical protein
MKTIKTLALSLVLLSSSLFSQDVYRSGYSTGDNIKINISEPAKVYVYMTNHHTPYQDRIYDVKNQKPHSISIVDNKFALTEKGYYVIKVTPLSAILIATK